MPLQRCPWLDLDKPDYVAYHDREWGVPVHDDRKHFEFLTLESAQAGLSWYTVLRKRANYRQAFAKFDPAKSLVSTQPKSNKCSKIPANSQSPQDQRGRRKRSALPRRTGRIRQLQRLYLALCRWRAHSQRVSHPRRFTSHQPRIRRLEQRPQKPRLQIHRLDRHLRPHAGHRHGQRPRPRLLPPPSDSRHRLGTPTVSILNNAPNATA